MVIFTWAAKLRMLSQMRADARRCNQIKFCRRLKTTDNYICFKQLADLWRVRWPLRVGICSELREQCLRAATATLRDPTNPTTGPLSSPVDWTRLSEPCMSGRAL